MISMLEFLIASGVDINIDDTKVHLAIKSSSVVSPLDAYFNGEFEEWQNVQNGRNFQCDKVISLIHLDGERWLFAGVYKVNGIANYKKQYRYDMTLINSIKDVIGRLVINYPKGFRNSYPWLETINDHCTVGEILADKMTVQPYPGHNSVILSYDELNVVINQEEKTWYGALSNIKGIYCITDITNGKHYVGKADGVDGIWQRWSTYANNGHGDNKELKKLLKEKGKDYKKNFQFALVEIADFRTSDEDINDRESHWKNALLSRTYGYNSN